MLNMSHTNTLKEATQVIQEEIDRVVAEKQAKVDFEIMKLRLIKEAEFRKKIGLTQLEQDASIIYNTIQQAAVELARTYANDKPDSVKEIAALKVANTRLMYESVCRKIFKLCLKHGLESECLE